MYECVYNTCVQLGGIVTPNDGRCHLDNHGIYTESLNQVFNIFVVNCHNLNLYMESMLWFCCLFDGKSTTAYSLTYSKTLYRSAIFFRGVPLMGCCHVDDTSSEHADVGLAPGWVDADVSQLYTSIGPPQPGGMWLSTRSPPVVWLSKVGLHHPYLT